MVKIRKKKNAVIKWLPYLAGILLLAFIFLFQTRLDKRNVQKVAEETLAYARATCDRYDVYVNDQQSKDLMSLQEKARSIALYEAHGVAICNDILEAYVEDENLTGVVVTDGRGKIVQTCGEQAAVLFQDRLKNEPIAQILKFPQKVYMEQAEIDGKKYNLAVVSREKQDGLILCYHEVVIAPIGENDISIDGMLSGYLFKMDGIVVITDGKVVLNNNRLHVQGQLAADCSITITDSKSWADGKLTRLDYEGKHWYGEQDVYKKYTIYVMYPSGQVFATRTTMFAFSTAIYIFFLLILAFLRNCSAQSTMRELQKQFRIIKAISRIYKMNVLIHLDTGEWEAIRMPGEVGAILQKEGTAGNMLERYIQSFVSSEYQDGYRKFVDLESMESRFAEKDYIPYVSEDDGGTWSYSILTPQQWDENGNVKAVVWAIRDVTADRQKELSYQKKIEQAAMDNRKF